MAESDAGSPEKKPEERDVTTQRVRVGLTGLAAVFLLTLLAASIFNLLGQDDPKGLKLSNGTMITNIAEPVEPPKEPLAELGVAPGAAPLKPTVIAIPAGPTVPPPDNMAAPATPAPHPAAARPQGAGAPAPAPQPQTAQQQPTQPATR